MHSDILESIYDGYYEVDALGRLVVLNSSLCEILQLSKDELVDHNYWQYLSRSTRRGLIHLFKFVRETRFRRRSHEFDFELADGKLLALEASSTPIFDADGVMTGMRGIIRNVTDRRAAERKSQESEERYRSLFEQNTDAVFQFDLDGRIIDANQAATRIMGYSFQALRGKPLELFLSNDDAAKVGLGLHGAKRGLVQDYELDVQRRDGKSVRVHVKTVPIAVNNRKIGIYAICRDITAQVETEALLARSEKLSLVGQLAAGIAHEIRNPLSALKGFLQLCVQMPESVNRYINIMYAELERIEQITNELLAFARPHPTMMRPVDVAAMIDSVEDLLSSQALMQGVEFETTFLHGREQLYCEVDRIRQVLVNLVKNAIDSMNTGGIVQIRTRLVGDDIEISVHDAGVGMDENTLLRIGEPFYTTKPTGTGLGTMVCQRIVESHQGTISWSSRLGEGTTATVRLPRASQRLEA